MQQKMKSGVDLYRKLHDVALARQEVLYGITGADVGSFDSVIARLEKLRDQPRASNAAVEPWSFEERYREAADSLLEHFRKLNDGDGAPSQRAT